MAVVARGGKPALTRYRVLRVVGTRASLVQCRLATGRTHQIRVHMAGLGHSIIGDPLYGRDAGRRLRDAPEAARRAVAAFDRQALHACLIGFRHPGSGKWLRFRSEIPPDINELVGLLEAL
jgi:23S rRNA pseudouridine1911/1915/1917 synthase